MKKNKKRIIKILTFLITLIIMIVLIKSNIKATKEKPLPPEESKSATTTKLDNSSQVLNEILKNSYMDLVNNNVEPDKYIISDTYSFMYFKFDGEKKELSDDEKLYIAFNNLYIDGKYTENKDSLIFDKTAVYDAIDNIFSKQNYENFLNNLKLSSCGIKNFVFTGENFELEIDKCKDIDKTGYINIYNAYKEADNINIYVEAFYVEGNINENLDTEIKIKNYNDEEITTTSIVDLEENLKKAYESQKVSKYKLNYRLMQDKYYLVSIEKI